MNVYNQQLLQCMQSIHQLIVAIESAQRQISSDSNTDQNVLVPLHEAKYGLVGTAVQIALMSCDTVPSLTTKSADVGDIVLAPRYAKGTGVSYDLAIVIDVIDDMEEEDTNDDNQDQLECSVSDSVAKLLWIRPQSFYEFVSCGFSLAQQQIRIPAAGIRPFELQTRLLANLRVNDSVLVAAYQKRMVWATGRITKIYDTHGTVDIHVMGTDRNSLQADISLERFVKRRLDEEFGPVIICSPAIEQTVRISDECIRCRLQLSAVAPILYNCLTSSSSSSSISSPQNSPSVANSLDESDRAGVSEQQVKSSFVYHLPGSKQSTAKGLRNTSSMDPYELSVPFDVVAGFGGWERHTKG
jgi:hypothetical protein